VENLALWKRALAEFGAVFLLASIGLMTVATAITTGAYGLFELSIAFGFAITVMVVVSGAEAPLTMACINPARDLGPRIVIAILGWGAAAFPGVGRPWWVWTVGPILGAVVGGVAWSFVFGRFQTPRPVDVEAAGTQADRLETPTPGGDPTTTVTTTRETAHHGREDPYRLLPAQRWRAAPVAPLPFDANPAVPHRWNGPIWSGRTRGRAMGYRPGGPLRAPPGGSP
jgi:Major intrinsic protein